MNRSIAFALCVVSALAAAGAAAQPVVGPIGGNEPSTPPPGRSHNATLYRIAPTQLPSPFTWAGLSLLPHPNYRFMYSDGLLFRPGRALNSYIQNVAPGIAIKAGEHWFLDYTPTWNFYSNRQFRDTCDQSVLLSGNFDVANSAVQFAQNYTSSSSVTVETARQTKQEIVFTSLGVSHAFTSNWAIELNGTQQLSFIEQMNDVFDWSGTGWLHYMPSADLDFAVGYTGGYVQIYHSPNLVNSTPGLQVNWHPVDPLTVRMQVGLQHTRFISGGRSTLRTVMYQGSLGYTPRDGTLFTASVKRSVSPSFFTNDVTENRTWDIRLRQRLLQHFTLSTGYAEHRSHYILTVRNLVRDSSVEEVKDDSGNIIGYITTVTTTPVITFLARDDVNRVIDVRLSTTWLKRGTFSVMYQAGRNHSTVAGYRYNNKQIGFEIGWRY